MSRDTNGNRDVLIYKNSNRARERRRKISSLNESQNDISSMLVIIIKKKYRRRIYKNDSEDTHVILINFIELDLF